MNLEELWQSTLGEIELQLPRASFATWLKNSRLLENKDGVLYIALPNNFTKEWVEHKYQKTLLGIIRATNPAARKLEFVVDGQLFTNNPQKKAARNDFVESENLGLDSKPDPETNLNPRYTMNSFVVGGFNELAFAAAEAIAKDVGTKYNPFFVYGGVGLGKTHLIQSIGNEIKTLHRNKIRPYYVSSEKFTSDVVWAIRNKRMEDVKRRYRDVDVLIIDDIQFIGGKEKTEEEFFHTFNTLYEHRKQIIISSDRPPQAIPTLEERLRSRFEGGLIADISYPDYETRVAIVKRKLQELGKGLRDEVVELIAKKVRKNIREIEGVLTKLLFYQEKKLVELSERAALEIIEKSVQGFTKNISEGQILKAVAEFFSVQLDDLTGRCRKKEIVEPRQIAMYFLRDVMSLSYPYIGEKFGRDHTTAIHSYEKINREINKNSSLNQKVLMIKETMYKS